MRQWIRKEKMHEDNIARLTAVQFIITMRAVWFAITLPALFDALARLTMEPGSELATAICITRMIKIMRMKESDPLSQSRNIFEINVLYNVEMAYHLST